LHWLLTLPWDRLTSRPPLLLRSLLVQRHQLLECCGCISGSNRMLLLLQQQQL
jgi:hypothetical protein